MNAIIYFFLSKLLFKVTYRKFGTVSHAVFILRATNYTVLDVIKAKLMVSNGNKLV